MNDKQIILEEKIIELLSRGLDLSEDTIFFAESTYGLKPSMLKGALNDSRFEDRDTLLSLILIPGGSMRELLEPLLLHFTYPSAALPAFAARIYRRISSINVFLPDGSDFLLHIEPEEMNYLVEKLYLERVIDPSVARALKGNLSMKTTIAARLILRCKGDYLYPQKRDFLVRFIEKCGSFEDTFIELFSLVLTLAAEVAENDSIDRHIIDRHILKRKRHVIKTIKNIEMFEEKREHYSMEYLMMQRYPVPHESMDEMLEQLYLLTIITETILGHPPDPSIRHDFSDLGRYRPTKGLEQLINLLS